MDNPLRYQMTEYACGPTSMLNAVSYLFQREEIPPEIKSLEEKLGQGLGLPVQLRYARGAGQNGGDDGSFVI